MQDVPQVLTLPVQEWWLLYVGRHFTLVNLIDKMLNMQTSYQNKCAADSELPLLHVLVLVKPVLLK